MSTPIFGTDGIRGPVGSSLVNEEFFRQIGYGIASYLRSRVDGKPLTVIMGRDPRESSLDLEAALVEGLYRNDIHVVLMEVVPTPAVSAAVCDMHADLGLMITASHNPATDNGLKIFDHEGLKLSPHVEAALTACIQQAREKLPPASGEHHAYAHEGSALYVNFMASQLDLNCLRGWKIILDTANGATATTSPAAFRHFGAELVQIGHTPDGQNINDGVGSEHPEKMAAAVLEHGARLGIAHDGDGDRVVICDEKGSILHGEELIGLLALFFLRKGQLAHKTLVTTVQSNLGLDQAIRAAGGRVIRVPVGDRNILLRMLEDGYSFGGEESGHLIFCDASRCGDGLMGAIKTAQVMLETGEHLSSLRKQVTLFPQAKKNLGVSEKRPLHECRGLTAAIAQVEKDLGDTGRLLVRFSGTEAKLRLLVEAPSEHEAQRHLARLVEAAERDLAPA